MKTYQVYVDLPLNGDWANGIEVESIEVKAFNCNDAYIQAHREIEHEDFYVWEVTEEDIIV